MVNNYSSREKVGKKKDINEWAGNSSNCAFHKNVKTTAKHLCCWLHWSSVFPPDHHLMEAGESEMQRGISDSNTISGIWSTYSNKLCGRYQVPISFTSNFLLAYFYYGSHVTLKVDIRIRVTVYLSHAFLLVTRRGSRWCYWGWALRTCISQTILIVTQQRHNCQWPICKRIYFI